MLTPLVYPLRWYSPAGARGRLSVLILHRVLPAPDPLFPDEMHAGRFDAICRWLRVWFNVMPLDAAVAALKTGSLPERALSITFDDGYADNHDVALPILQRHGLCATFFVSTGFLDGGIMWNDAVIESFRRTTQARLDLSEPSEGRLGSYGLENVAQRRAAISAVIDGIKYMPPSQRSQMALDLAAHAAVELPRDLMMSSGQVRRLHHGGMQIGAHTVSHPILRNLDLVHARSEMQQSKQCLEALLQSSVDLFAYPNGKWNVDFDAAAAGLAKELGFQAAVTTDWGSADARTDLFRIPRFMPWDRSMLRFGLRLAGNLRHNAGTLAVSA